MEKKIRDNIRKQIQRPSDWTQSNPKDFKTTRTNIYKYVVSILERYTKASDKDLNKVKAIAEYFDVKDIEKEEVRNDLLNCSLTPGSFRAINQLLNKPEDDSNDKVPTQRIIRFTCTLFELELRADLVETNFNAQTRLEQEFSQNIRGLYLENEDFTQIRVVGDIRHDSRPLSMDDYYMDLSYLKREDIEARDSLLLKEKESFRNKISQNKIPHSYISDSILATENRVVIMGNPGTGKSTFARWLCHHWAKAPQADQPTLIYISLRELNLNHDNQVIEEYIQNNYLKQASFPISRSEISQFVARPKQVRLVLDGLDELSDNRKKLLNTQLTLLKQQNSYILLSRPYGLFNNSFHQTASIEIIGYNNSSRSRYIDSMLVHKKQNKQEELLEIIQNNPVLNDLSYNPLMLSYLTLLYLDDEVENSLMAQIESTYQLQDLVLGWMNSYTSQRNAKQGKKFAKYAGKGEALADHLELKQEFVYYSRSFDDVYCGVTENLAKAGLGRKEILNNRGDWKFHFQTITTQEYLAAKHVGGRISPEAFLYVAQKQIYWNYAKMILGYKSFQGDHEFIEQILMLVNQYHKNNDKIYYKYLYFSLLAETGISQLNALTDQELISDLFYYHDYASADKRWHSLISDAIARIYAKLKPEWKLSFTDNLIQKIQHNFTLYIEQQQSAILIPMRSLFRLAQNLNLHQDPDFTGSIPKLILNTIKLNEQKSQANKAMNQLFEQLLYNELGQLLIILEQAPRTLLLPLMNDLKQVHLMVHDVSLKQKIERAANYFDRKTSFVNRYHELDTLIRNWDNTEVDEEEMESSLIEICQHCHKLAFSFSNSSEGEKDHIQEMILNCHQMVLSQDIEDHWLLNDLIETLHKANCDLKAKSLVADMYFLEENRLLDVSLFSKHKVDRLLKLCLTRLDENPELFEDAFYIVATQKELPYQHLDIYLDLMQKKIMSMASASLLEEMDEEQYEAFRFPLQQVRMIAGKDQTHWLVLSKVMNMELMKNEGFKEECLPELIRCSEFHAPEVWELIKQFAAQQKMKNEVIEILVKQELYLYPSNLKAILSTWEILMSVDCAAMQNEQLTDITNLNQACFLLLTALKENTSSSIPTNLLEKLSEALSEYQSSTTMAEVNDFYENELGEATKENAYYKGWENEWQVGKILNSTSSLNSLLLNLLLKQKNCPKHVHTNFQNMSQVHQKDFKAEIIRLFTQDELKKLDYELGKELHLEIMNYSKELNHNSQPFSRKLYQEKMKA